MSELLLDAQYRVRAALIEALRTDLEGPRTPTEVIDDAPITSYIVGVLYPQSTDLIAPELDNDAAEDGADGQSEDPGVSMAHIRYPSSVGFSFAVHGDFRGALDVHVSCARYEQVGEQVPPDKRTPHADGRGAASWRRVPIAAEIRLDIGAPDSGSRRPVADGLELFARSRWAAGSWAVTLALVNSHRVPVASGEKDAFSFFQSHMTVEAAVGGTSPFVERPNASESAIDADARSSALLYRHSRTYAVGHGCGVDWDRTQDPPKSIGTTYTPAYELRLAESNPDIELKCLDLAFLANGARDRVVAALRELPATYAAWIAVQRELPVDGVHRSAAAAHLRDCAEACQRISSGIDLLERDAATWEAFQLASRALLTVRSRAEWHRSGRSSGGPSETGISWYPFQLAFILLCIEGVVDPGSADRDLVDLLWFPTGGGKTEAYLGLIAFTIFHRRLRLGVSGAGVTSLMRYTLRLLTIQQFERAASLICACETLRREDAARLGQTPVSLGLYVGQGGTPNTRDEARAQLKKLRAGVTIEQANPVQLKSCPWCRTQLDERNYNLSFDKSRLIISCPNDKCPFYRDLPVFVVDDDVYDHHPTLIIATADKFAGIAWRPQAHALFNLDRAGTPPPELIVQDELHLIAGPLGTLAGLYEAAIDGVASTSGARPKVVASTATIRRAQAQTIALFAREVRQFPPAGIDSRDSFFAVEASRDRKGTRLYVGLMAPGSSQTTLLVRSYARLLQSAYASAAGQAAVDPYWTLLGYFNSLRVLSGARMQVHNDVVDRLKLLEPNQDDRRPIDKVIELTSRESSADIPGYLDQLSTSGPDALDVVLATNMISVGVDIDRLGLMVVMGQPQGTAEYIQATSRVGRRYPGLVVVLLNSARSRDRSHYEGFAGYHGALYRQVESSSVTPYSPRARDRALHAALVAAVRMRIVALRDNGSASQVDKHLDLVNGIRDELVERAKFVSSEDAQAVRDHLDEIIAHWVARAREDRRLRYSDKDPELALLVDAADPDAGDREKGGPFGTLWSLRDVDRSSNLFLLR